MWILSDIYKEQRSIKKSLKLNYNPCMYPSLESAQKAILKFAIKPVIFKWKDGTYFITALTDEKALIEREYPCVK